MSQTEKPSDLNERSGEPGVISGQGVDTDATPTAETLFLQEKITLVVTFLPVEGQAASGENREVLLGIRNGDDIPLFSRCLWEEIEALPPVLASFISELKNQLPARYAERKARQTPPTTVTTSPVSDKSQPQIKAKSSSPVAPVETKEEVTESEALPDIEQPTTNPKKNVQLSLF